VRPERDPLTDADAAFGVMPAVGALAALAAYGFLVATPSVHRPDVPAAAPFAAVAFALLQVLLPACRPSRAHLVSPLNWIVLAFFLQLVVLPLIISWAGPAVATLPFLPGRRALDRSMLISMGAFAAFSIGYALFAVRGDAAPQGRGGGLPRSMVLAYAAIGLVGVYIRFGSVGELFATLADPTRLLLTNAEQDGTLRGVASTFLRPFLLSSIVMAWGVWVDRGGAAAPRVVRLALTALAAAGIVLVGATYQLNRASFVVPLLALTAAYSVHVRRLSLGALAATALLLALLAVPLGKYRTSDVTAADLARGTSGRDEVLRFDDLDMEIQVYASAPQFAGFLLETAQSGNERFTAGTLVSSVLSPVPILGKGFRESSGHSAYNRLIYGNTGIADQIAPFEAEVYLCLGPAGLVAAFLLLGAAIARLQRGFERASTAFDTYAIQFTAMWVAFLVQGSIASVAQIFVFFFWPIYGYVLLRAFLRPRGARGRALDRPASHAV
jgi:hypothetical protein